MQQVVNAAPTATEGARVHGMISAMAGAGFEGGYLALFLSVRTVSNHLQHAYIKLGVSSRAGLAHALASSP